MDFETACDNFKKNGMESRLQSLWQAYQKDKNTVPPEGLSDNVVKFLQLLKCDTLLEPKVQSWGFGNSDTDAEVWHSLSEVVENPKLLDKAIQMGNLLQQADPDIFTNEKHGAQHKRNLLKAMGAVSVLSTDIMQQKEIVTAVFKLSDQIYDKLDAEGGSRSGLKLSQTMLFIKQWLNYDCEPEILASKIKFLQHTLRKVEDLNEIIQVNKGFDYVIRQCKRYSPGITDAAIANILPIVTGTTPERNIFVLESNKWGIGITDYGIADYYFKAYTDKITPANLNELMMISRECLTDEYGTYHRNREDAIALSEAFNGLRDAIHDQRLGIGDVVKSMVRFYDASQSGENTDEAKQALQKEIGNFSQLIYPIEHAFDLEYYDKAYRVEDTGKDESGIEILRRLSKNLDNNAVKLPRVESEELMAVARPLENAEYLQSNDIEAFFHTLNKTLEQKIHNDGYGISPRMVRLLCWAEKKAARFCNEADFEYQSGMYKEPAFKEILKFSEIVYSSGHSFDAQNFETFYQDKVLNANGMEDAYKNVCARQTKYLLGLNKKYSYQAQADKKTIEETYCKPNIRKLMQNQVDMQLHSRLEHCGSGNLLKALQNLSCYHDASTKIGKRYLQEARENYNQMKIMRQLFHGENY